MGKLHELLAVEGNLEDTYRKVLEEAKVTFHKKADHFIGSHKKLKMHDVADEHLETEEFKHMDTTVPDKLDYLSEHIIRYFDATLQKEATNQDAKADIIIDGVTIAKDMPATFLLGLEARLKYVRSVIEYSPTLSPGIEWEKDAALGDRVWKRKHPEEKFKYAKTFMHKTLYDATKEHPAQIEKWEENVAVGKYIIETTSGMLSPLEKSQLIGRIDKLIQAVKKARQRANTADVKKVDIGKTLMDYILKG
jgi:hypothetical protein